MSPIVWGKLSRRDRTTRRAGPEWRRESEELYYISIDIIIFVNGLGRLSLLRDTSRARCLARNGDDGS